MPLYQCLVPAGSLNADRRAALAEAITTVHATVTGAPRGFVNVVFVEYEPSAYFTAGRPNTVSVIAGTIRAGRDRATRAELLTRLSEAWLAITGQDARSLMIGLNEVDPTSIMEAGLAAAPSGCASTMATVRALLVGGHAVSYDDQIERGGRHCPAPPERVKLIEQLRTDLKSKHRRTFGVAKLSADRRCQAIRKTSSAVARGAARV